MEESASFLESHTPDWLCEFNTKAYFTAMYAGLLWGAFWFLMASNFYDGTWDGEKFIPFADQMSAKDWLFSPIYGAVGAFFFATVLILPAFLACLPLALLAAFSAFKLSIKSATGRAIFGGFIGFTLWAFWTRFSVPLHPGFPLLVTTGVVVLFVYHWASNRIKSGHSDLVDSSGGA